MNVINVNIACSNMLVINKSIDGNLMFYYKYLCSSVVFLAWLVAALTWHTNLEYVSCPGADNLDISIRCVIGNLIFATWSDPIIG